MADGHDELVTRLFVLIVLFGILFVAVTDDNEYRPGSSGTDAARAWVERWSYQCTTQGVASGDVLVCNDSTAVRLIGIDAPEGSYGEIGVSSARELLGLAPPGTVLRLELDESAGDQFGRIYAYAFGRDHQMLNEVMVENGYALAVAQPPNLVHQERLERAAERARKAKKGLWGEETFLCFAAGKSSAECRTP